MFLFYWEYTLSSQDVAQILAVSTSCWCGDAHELGSSEVIGRRRFELSGEVVGLHVPAETRSKRNAARRRKRDLVPTDLEVGHSAASADDPS